MKKVTMIQADSSEIDSIVREVFPNYEFVPVQECGNDSSHEFDVCGIVDDKHGIEQWKNGEFVRYSNDSVLNYMATLGKLEVGTYLIDVCW